jgi:hypothetical protein
LIIVSPSADYTIVFGLWQWDLPFWAKCARMAPRFGWEKGGMFKHKEFGQLHSVRQTSAAKGIMGVRPHVEEKNPV